LFWVLVKVLNVGHVNANYRPGGSVDWVSGAKLKPHDVVVCLNMRKVEVAKGEVVFDLVGQPEGKGVG
jgi:hypothetical protein